MNKSCDSWWAVFVWSGLVWLALAATAGAHGPFDNSSRLYVMEDRLELALTVGLDGARQILTRAGMSAEETTRVLALSGPSSFREMPVAIATNLFALKAAAAPLPARRLWVHTDGIEANFTLDLPRPANAALSVLAKYFEGVEQCRFGDFTVTDDNGNVLGEAVLSRGSPSAEFVLSALATPSLVKSDGALAAGPPIRLSSTNGSVAVARALPAGARFTGWRAVALAMFGAAVLAGRGCFRR